MTKSSMSSFSQQQQIDPKILAQWTSKKQDRRTVIVFAVLTVFFTILGILLVTFGSDIQEYSVSYGNSDCSANTTCSVTLTVEEKMTGPVYLYFRLDNFFQNHQRYTTSRDIDQLAGTYKSVSDLKSCAPIITNRDAGVYYAIDGTTVLDPDAPAIPCGLIAHTMVTDTYEMTEVSTGKSIALRESGIAWESDKDDSRYKNIDTSKQWLNMTSERFMNWMRLAGLNDFRKLWAIIDQDLDKGDYKITIKNVRLTSNYDIAKFDTDRRIIVTTINNFGGKNVLLVVCYLLAAALSWIILAIFLVRMVRNRKKRA